MNHAHHTTLWCEARLEFWKYFKDCSHHFRTRRPDHAPYDKIPVHFQVSTAENMEVPSITIYDPEWKESATYPNPYGYGRPFQLSFNTKGHNWWGVARIDIGFYPTDVPFIYSGKIYTGSSYCDHTCKLTRLKSIHQARRVVPNDALLTPLGDGITRAEWTARRHCRHGWIDRSTRHTAYLTYLPHHGWIAAPSPESAISQAVLHRLNLQSAA